MIIRDVRSQNRLSAGATQNKPDIIFKCSHHSRSPQKSNRFNYRLPTRSRNFANFLAVPSNYSVLPKQPANDTGTGVEHGRLVRSYSDSLVDASSSGRRIAFRGLLCLSIQLVNAVDQLLVDVVTPGRR